MRDPSMANPPPATPLVLALAATLCLVGTQTAMAATPTTLAINGVLLSAGGGPAADGDYGITFSLYDKAKGGTPAWSEALTKVSVSSGHWSHVLGSKKPITAALLQSLGTAWIGVKISFNPELPRQPLHSVAYALRSASADALACSGCITASHLAKGALGADKVGFTYAGAKTKGGPASLALDLQCTGCVSVAEMNFDKDIDLGKYKLKAAEVSANKIAASSVVANTYLGDGSKLTGIKLPKGKCTKKGDVVQGIAPDGTLICVAAMDASALPPDGLDEISNGLLSNQFVDEVKVTKTIAIPDNNPTGVSGSLDFPDIGTAQKLWVSVDISNSKLSALTVWLFGPDNVKVVLYAKGAKGKSLKATYPAPTKPVSGDLGKWIGKNPKGKWRLQVIDTDFLNNKTDGQVNNWSVGIQTLSTKKVEAKGDLLIGGKLIGKNGVDFGSGQAKYMRLHNSKTEPVKCTAAVEGLIYYDPASRTLRVCNGKNYFGLSVAVGDGSVLSPGKSCKSILDSGSSKGDSTYWLDPDGANGPVKPFQAFCDMKGGGWTKVTETTNYAYKVWCESACEKSYVYGLSSAQIDAIRALSNSAKQTYACETKGVGSSYNLRGWDGKLFAVSTACWAANNSDHKKSSGSYTNFAVVPLKSWYSVDCGDASEGCAHNVGDAWFR